MNLNDPPTGSRSFSERCSEGICVLPTLKGAHL